MSQLAQKNEPTGAKIEPSGISLFRISVVTITLYAGFAMKKINDHLV
jgi:hypothetical protein